MLYVCVCYISEYMCGMVSLCVVSVLPVSLCASCIFNLI